VDALADDLLRDLVPAEVVAITQLAQKAPAVTPVTRPSTLWGRKAPLDKTKSLLVGGNSDHYFQEAKRVKETAKKQVKASGVTRNIAARDSLKEDAELVERGELWRNGSARGDTSSKENLDPTDGIEETTRGRSLLETISSIELLPGKDHPGSGQAKPEPQSLVRIDGRLMDLKKQVNVLRVEELDVAERLSSIDYIEAGAALTQDVNTSDVLRLARQKSSNEIERKELIPSGLLPMHPKIAALETDQEDVETPLATTEKRLEREQAKLAVLKEKTERPDIEGLPPAPSEPAGPVNPFVMSEKDALSTFALESEAASYVLSRRYLRAGYKPPPGIVRMEEFVNAFDYNYPSSGERTFSVHTEAALSPFGKGLTLLKVGVRGKVIGRDGRKPAHLVFVIDASGSMARPDRLPMVREALTMLVEQLGDQDRVSLISYASRAHLLLDGASASDKARIIDSLHRIECTAATNVLEGVRVGYQIAARHFQPNAVNRVILCSDGVANVGPNDADAMLAMVNTQRRQGIAITTVGVGAGSYNDGLMEQLANRGDGNYVYIDSLAEAHRVFVENFSATLNTIARDVKIQVAFDPKRVRRYRLIGYENRKVKDQDFRNDKVDAGEIGSGQSATALYELELHEGAEASDLGTVFGRYKENDGGEVQEFASRLRADLVRAITPAESPRFFMAAAVAEFAEILRQSPHAQRGSLRAVEQMLLRTSQALPQDSQLAELLQLVRQSQDLPVFGE
jgi:Ca-activated chloride channel family protein